MSVSGLAPLPLFLPTPDHPDVAWRQWIRLFENFLVASGVSDCAPNRRKVLLIPSLGLQGQRIFHTLLLQSSANAKSGEPTTDTDSGAVKDTSQTQHEAPSDNCDFSSALGGEQSSRNSAAAPSAAQAPTSPSAAQAHRSLAATQSAKSTGAVTQQRRVQPPRKRLPPKCYGYKV
ncbi:hypothetical protein HPB51_005809 [Rhipicephalus microplus]|uniref:Uncharacterized protein n=1 Tax=Rhipicephalus microplus TaxID=6941 RepID=A0A9J6ERK7_RHIMP|nr:hypothetical protein HPB51_005809 [Rhipicephalus microplus]